MGPGKRYRMGRIFGENGRTLVLPVDHGLTLGRIQGLEDPVGVLEGLLDLPCDGLLMAPGLTRHTAGRFARRGTPARILTLDSHFRVGDEPPGADLVASVEQAAALGVDAVKLYMAWNVPARDKSDTLARIAGVIERAERLALPVMVEPIAVGEPRSPETIALEGDAARSAMEVGADIIKVAYPGAELMEAWASELQVPLVILGGPRSGDPEGVLTMAEEAVGSGARGIVIGRNVWQRPPDVTRRLMARLHDIVHPSSDDDAPLTA
jgi:class I fructose-bisphosphate aldolase